MKMLRVNHQFLSVRSFTVLDIIRMSMLLSLQINIAEAIRLFVQYVNYLHLPANEKPKLTLKSWAGEVYQFA